MSKEEKQRAKPRRESVEGTTGESEYQFILGPKAGRKMEEDWNRYAGERIMVSVLLSAVGRGVVDLVCVTSIRVGMM